MRRTSSLLALSCLAAAGCGKPGQAARATEKTADQTSGVALSPLDPSQDPGGAAALNPYEGNAYAMNEGKRLFSAFNCVGCHAYGGGGIGPALMDGTWRYGSEPVNLFQTIVGGRPNGMPSFGGKIPDYYVWRLVAYVRSMAGLAPKDAAPGRNDSMSVRRPENLTSPAGTLREPAEELR